MKFTHLHVHSHYSLLDGLPKIDELLDYVKKLGMDSLALTDHGVLYGAVEFFKKAKQKNIKPVIGCEFYTALERMQQKRPNIDNKRYHLVLLAKNKQGYQNLVQLVTKAHLQGFYYKPRIDDELLSKHSQGLIGLSACIQGKIPQLIIAGKTKQAEETALKYQEILGKGNFYLEIQDHPNLKNQQKVNEVLIRLSKKFDIPLVATNDCHYLRPEDAAAQDVLMLINTGADPNDAERLTMKSDDFSVRPPKQMMAFCQKMGVTEAIENTQKIVEMCNFEFELGKTTLPYFETPDKQTADEYLKKLCFKGLKKKQSQIEEGSEQIKQRLTHELSVIKETGFASYFLIVQDFVNWAKEHGIVVGPGRGSDAGSLVSYLLNITEVNPLKYNLLFERFLNKERISMPDCDLDFTDRRRDEVINYVTEKYGRDHIAQIITFGTMAARAVIRDVGRATGLSYNFCDRIAKMIPFGSTLSKSLKNVAEFRQLYKTNEQARKLIDTAKKLEGVARHASTHACGVVISKEPLTKLVPLQHPTQNDKNIVTQYDMHAVEDLGLLKMDFLGLKNLTIIEDTINKISANYHKKIEISKIPFDDKKTYQTFQKAQTTGVFQCESSGFRRYLKQLKPTSFEDIIVMVALYRPGPMELIPEYIERKHKRKKTEYIHPSLKPVLETTYAIPVFQEQIMQIARTLAGFSLSEADILRKAIGKKIKGLLEAQKEKFIQGCIKNNIARDIAEKVFKWIEPHARYSFNKAHATAYAMIAYQTAYLKTHYPTEFMAAVLGSENQDTERMAVLINECRSMDIEVLPPDVNESDENFTVVSQDKIRFGLLAIKNVGHNVVTAIVKERKNHGSFQSIDDFLTRINPTDLNKRSLESLIMAGALDELAERNQLLSNLTKLLERTKETQEIKDSGQKSLFEKTTIDTGLKLTPAPPASKKQKLKWEKELLGLYLSGHPLAEYENILEQQAVYCGGLDRDMAGQFLTVGGIITNIKKINTRNGNLMLFAQLEDKTGKIEVVVFPKVLQNNPSVWQENNIVLVRGLLGERDGTLKLSCNGVKLVG